MSTRWWLDRQWIRLRVRRFWRTPWGLRIGNAWCVGCMAVFAYYVNVDRAVLYRRIDLVFVAWFGVILGERLHAQRIAPKIKAVQDEYDKLLSQYDSYIHRTVAAIDDLQAQLRSRR